MKDAGCCGEGQKDATPCLAKNLGMTPKKRQTPLDQSENCKQILVLQKICHGLARACAGLAAEIFCLDFFFYLGDQVGRKKKRRQFLPSRRTCRQLGAKNCF